MRGSAVSHEPISRARTAAAVVASVWLASAAIDAAAQNRAQAAGFPDRPIRLIVPTPPGASTDVVARIIGNKLSDILQQQVVVDNRGGAGGIIATAAVAKAAPNGYTLLFAYAGHTTTPFLTQDKLPYDPATDFAAVTLTTTQPLVLTANLSLPASSVKELIALAKAKPDQLRVGTAGIGGSGHIAAELFKLETGTSISTIIYNGGGPAQIGLLQGDVHFIFATTSAAMPHIKAGKLKVLATSSSKRLPYLPEVPTFNEVGMPQLSLSPWQGILAPARTPRAVIDKVYGAVVTALKQPDTLQRLAATGSDVEGSTPEEFSAKIRKELEYYGRVIKAANIKVN